MSSSRGVIAERSARVFLEERGLKTECCNFRCRFGEIDIIMQDGPTLVFVEVRLRAPSRFASAIASIDARKQQRLTLTAASYLAQREQHTSVSRFDIVGLTSPTDTQPTWLRNVFFDT